MMRSRIIRTGLVAATLLGAATGIPAQPATRPAVPAADLSGLYTIGQFKASNAANRTGFFRLVRRGDAYVVGIQFNDKDKEQWQGVAVRVGDCLIAAGGPPPTVSLADYRVAADGTLHGALLPLFAPGGDPRLTGSEKLTGPAQFGGTYQIAESRAPRTAAAYRGTVDVAAAGGATLGGEYPVYNVSWNLVDPQMGDVKLPGVGVKLGDRFLVSSAGPKQFGVYLIRPAAGRSLKVEYYMNGGAMGEFVLTPDVKK